jgi:hypothetical protein
VRLVRKVIVWVMGKVQKQANNFVIGCLFVYICLSKFY